MNGLLRAREALAFGISPIRWAPARFGGWLGHDRGGRVFHLKRTLSGGYRLAFVTFTSHTVLGVYGKARAARLAASGFSRDMARVDL